MLSAAARAISTLLPSFIEPEESSTSVTLSGLPSSRSSGSLEADAREYQVAVQGMRHDIRVNGEAVVPPGLLVAIVEGVHPLLGAYRVGFDVVSGARPVQGKLKRGAVGVQAERGNVVNGGTHDGGAFVVPEGGRARLRTGGPAVPMTIGTGVEVVRPVAQPAARRGRAPQAP